MKLVTDVKLQKREYLDCIIKKDKLSVLKDGKEIGKISNIQEILKYFKNGRKPKLAVKDINKDGSYKLTLVRWADLHGHTGYSLLDGAVRVNEKAEKTEYVSAITDHGNMFGIVDFHKEMYNRDKHPIIGMEGYIEGINGAKESNHIVLLAKNEVGYRNLLKLLSYSYENFYRKPHISYELLEKYSKGIIATSACIGGEIQQNLIHEDYEGAKEVAKRYKEIFKDDFYLEIQRHSIGVEEDLANEGILKLSKELNIPIVAGIDSHYLNPEDSKIHEMILALQMGKNMEDEDRMTFEGTGYHIHTADEVDELFKDIPEALNNTLEIASKCSLELEIGKLNMPIFDIPEGYTQESYLEERVMEGFERRYKDYSIEEREIREKRVKYELDVINQMGFPSYFLIVWDIVKYAKDNGIYVGPGRGSAIGSVVSYCLDIVDIDPVRYGLLFERFLNPERVTMPDIDIDFCYERRGEVIEYMKDKYGEKAVSRIVTQTTFAARGVVRDVVRLLNKPYSLGDAIAKSIPLTPGMTLGKAYEESQEFRTLYDSNIEAKQVIDIALKLEGLPRNTGVHACGIIVAPDDVNNFIPEFLAKKDGVVERTSQVTMSEVEELGLLKMDILGLKTMTILDKTIQAVNEKYDPNIDYRDLPINDPYVYRDISQGKSYGVFQLESPGMRGLMQKLYGDVAEKISIIEKKYNVVGTYKQILMENSDVEQFNKEMAELGNELFERLIAGISLYRPGPMDFIPDYLEGMANPDSIEYLTPELEPILKGTYGVVVYQEQVMKVVQELGGFSLGEADLLRRAMGKKLSDEVMEVEKNKFIYGIEEDGEVRIPGCVRKGIKAEVAEEIWHLMEDFNKYAFNKSHSAGYADISIRTAFFKYYYPVDFMVSNLNTFINDAKEMNMYLAACREMNIEIKPPRVNQSYEGFYNMDGQILYGLKGIKSISSMAEKIVEERKERGSFEDIQSFSERMARHEDINKTVMESLTYAGAFDEYGHTRNDIINAIPKILSAAKEEGKRYKAGQRSIFDVVEGYEDMLKINIEETKEFNKKYKLEKEKEYTGYYLTEHPLDDYDEFLKEENIIETHRLQSSVDIDDGTGEMVITESEISSGTNVKVSGILVESRVVYTKKNNEPMSLIKIEDRSGTINAVVFPRSFEMYSHLLQVGSIVFVEGKYQNDDRGAQIIVDTIVSPDRIMQAIKNTSINTIGLIAIDKTQLSEFSKETKYNVGDIPVYVKMQDKVLKSEKKITADLSTIMKLERIFGSDNVKLVS